MRIKGKKRHVSRATCFARALGIYDFTLRIKTSEKGYSYIESKKGGKHVIYLQEGIGKHLETEHIAHEMVHLKQHLTGDLRWDTYHYLWKGEKWFVPKYMSDDYFLVPWEMEARALESWLVHKWETRKSELH